jgi:hypothetical protein
MTRQVSARTHHLWVASPGSHRFGRLGQKGKVGGATGGHSKPGRAIPVRLLSLTGADATRSLPTMHDRGLPASPRSGRPAAG